MLPLVVVGLGNPGARYADTRHNIGFQVVEALARKLGFSFTKESRFFGRHASGMIDGRKVHLLLPETYMNESGRAVQALSAYYKVLVPEILIVQDDVALDYGVLRIKRNGTSGGQNGIKSIEASLGTNNFPRLKVGVGDNWTNSLVDHVLAPFTKEESETLPALIERAVFVLEELLHKDIHKVMTAVNTKGTKKNETER